MKIRLVLPTVNTVPAERPAACHSCDHWRLHRHGRVTKPVKDQRLAQVVVERYKCCGCGRIFRHYPAGVTAKDQSQHTVALAALMYGLGLSCSAAAHLLGALGVSVGMMTVWRDAQELSATLRQRLTGRVRVLGADETVYRVKGRKVVVGFVTDVQREQMLDFVVLEAQDGETFRQWLAPYVSALGVEVLVSDEHGSYGVAAGALNLEHQLCLAHVRKAVTRRAKSILAQAQEEREDDAHLGHLEAELTRIKVLVRELPVAGGAELEGLRSAYLWAESPRQNGEQASASYRMRLLTLELWEHWPRLRLVRRRPELGLDGTNNVSERSIGKSKVRYKTMRGYKSLEGMTNGIALTQWPYSGADRHDLAAAMTD